MRQPVAGFARFSVPDSVRQDNVVRRSIQQLARPEDLAGEVVVEKCPAVPARPVKDQYRVDNLASCVALRFADRGVVQTQFRERIPRRERKISGDPVALGRCWIIGGVHHCRQCKAAWYDPLQHGNLPRWLHDYISRMGPACSEAIS
jgi:hypothetical protein